MNNNKCKGFIRFVASSIATVGILGGGALGFAAGANASTATPDQMKRQHMAEERADPHSPLSRPASGRRRRRGPCSRGRRRTRASPTMSGLARAEGVERTFRTASNFDKLSSGTERSRDGAGCVPAGGGG